MKYQRVSKATKSYDVGIEKAEEIGAGTDDVLGSPPGGHSWATDYHQEIEDSDEDQNGGDTTEDEGE